MKTYLSAIGVCLLFAAPIACTTKEAPKPASTVTCSDAIRTDAILKILATNCTNRGCHPGRNAPPAANFLTAASLKNYVTNFSASFASRVTGPDADMPQEQGYPALARSTRDSIACWVSNGMKD